MDAITGRERLLITRHRNRVVTDPRALSRAVRRGEMIRLRSGAYVRAAVWRDLTDLERQRLEIAAALDVSPSQQTAAFRSAAAMCCSSGGASRLSCWRPAFRADDLRSCCGTSGRT